MLSNEGEDHSDQETEAEYTGAINLSGRHLKRIECLPEGVSPYTLLLSNNEISKVENLQYFVHLQQLSLSGNHIVDIKGIRAALSLKVLDLSNNSIVAIEGVSSLRDLEWLNLSGNSIEQIENLDRNSNLYHLDLSDNSIAVLSGLKTLTKLKTLLLHGNLISSLRGIEDQVPNTVFTLSLADNEISDLNEVVHLSSLIKLEQLSLVNNPCVLASSSWRLEVNYRPYLVYCCGNLRNLDGNLVNDQERMLARLLDQAFKRIGHPSQGQHVQLVSILYHLCSDSDPVDQTTQPDDLDCDMLLESESFYIPVPSSDVEQTESDDHIMTEEEAIRLFSLAATIIQAHVRGYLVRKKFDFCQYRRRKYAAASIQAVWKGYRARTRDIKVINIRNELRVRRLISLITNLNSALEREHEDAVKSREQLKTAIKYLWHQITEQKRLNQIQLHKEQVKAAIKIQVWWRGCMCKKAFPHKSLNRDKVTILFSLCRKLQMQLDVVTSKINEITKGEKQSKEFRLKDQTALEGQGQFYDTVRQLDSSHDDNITLSPEVEADHKESSALDQLNAKPGEYAAHLLDDEQAHIMKEGDLAIPGNNLPAQGQVGCEEKLVCSHDSSPLDRAESEMVPSSTEQVNHEEAESNIHKLDLGLTEETSFTDLEEGSIVTSTLTENNKGSSSYFEGNTECNERDEEHSLDRLKDHDTDLVTYSTHGEEDLPGESRVLSPVTHEESRIETEAIAFEAEVGQLEIDMVLPTGSPAATDVVSLESQLSEEVPSGDGSAEEALHVSIPEIIVSSPVPSDDEGSDAGSTFEDAANDVQREVELSETERQNIDDKQSGDDSSREVPSSCQEKDGHISNTDIYPDQTKENACPKQEGRISRKYHEINLLPFRSTVNFSASKEASTSKKPGKEAAVIDQSGRTVSSESVQVPNLGERASSLLSQLRSEIASMKTARLSNVSPIQAAASDGDATEKSQQRETSQPASQERDSSQPGAVSAVTYRLPLFEDVDSACSSFSLDDFLSDPVTEEALSFASETYHVHEEAGDY